MEKNYDDPKARVLVEELHLRELRRLLILLDAENIPSLLMKGTALAYSVYQEPSERVRLDSDIWIRPSDFQKAKRRLLESGFTLENTNLSVHNQAVFVSRDRVGIRHVFDLHLSALIPIALREALNFSECLQRSLKVPTISPSARRLNDSDSVALSCAHWVAHHFSSPHPFWLKDIQLLTEGKSNSWWQELEVSVRSKRIGKIASATLEQVRAQTGIQVPNSFIDKLKDAKGEEATEYFLKSNRNKLFDVYWDLKCLSTWNERFQLLKNHICPFDYLSSKYQTQSSLMIFLLNFGRVFSGLKKLSSKNRP